MNRKERRAAEKRRDQSARNFNTPDAQEVVSIADLVAEANRCYRAGRIGEAQAICRQILAREPDHVPTLNLNGLVAQASGDHRTAAKSFAKAIASDDSNAACHYNIGNSYQALGNRSKAIRHFGKALALGMEGKAVAFILQSPVISTYIARIAGKWPLPMTNAELFGAEGIMPIAKDLFLQAAMAVATLPNMQLELLLGRARAELLRLANGPGGNDGSIDGAVLGFACALARQCFINEYVYGYAEQEDQLASKLRDRLAHELASESAVTPLDLAVAAAYFPLHTIPAAEKLLSQRWPSAVDDLLKVQLREPLEEMADRAAIPSFGPLHADVSLQVMRQYEENPYPRWTVNPLSAFAADQARGKIAPSADMQARLDILIAGCGTGSHAIQIAQVYPNARLLALDLSLTSLAYARRKTRELGLRNIEYAQADILETGSMGRTFDRIESVGVLHHLAEPAVGWRVLVSLLRPGGKMRIGLYSRLARRLVAEARTQIETRGYRALADDMRRYRQDIFREANRWKALLGAKDFYGMSGCRDLLFNVMEHNFTIPEIAAFLSENGLSFLGFEPFDDSFVLEEFQTLFPGSADASNLEQWSRFEADHPDTFSNMYVFELGKHAP
jgi:SAM-dependent methyltransferase